MRKESEGMDIAIVMLIFAVIGGCLGFGIGGTLQSAFLGFGIGALVPFFMLMLGD